MRRTLKALSFELLMGSGSPETEIGFSFKIKAPSNRAITACY